MAPTHIVSDAPCSEDLLSFNRYVTPLYDILTDPGSETPLTVGLLGLWGSGKTTLLDLLDKQLEAKRHTNGLEFIRVKFNPWIYREEKNLLVPFLHTLRDHLESGIGPRFANSAKKLTTVLTEVGANVLLKTATIGQVNLKDLEDREKKYLARQRNAESAIRQLRSRMQEVICSATGDGKKARLVFFVDDLDRCDPFQVLDLLESVKLFLEQKFCFFLLAMDEEVISRGIQIKYNDYQFSDDRKAAIGAEYLDKMVQLPLYLYPLAADQVRSFVEKLKLSDAIRSQADSLAKAMLPNPRKIKRVCNLLSLNLGIREQDNRLLKATDPAILGKLIVLQVQDPNLYRYILQIPELTAYLRRVFLDKDHKDSIDPQNAAHFSGLKDHEKRVREICADCSRRAGWIKELFRSGRDFPSTAAELAPYFTMLGRDQVSS